MDVVRGVISETKAVRFEGNNYAAEWVEEAARRGLPNLMRTPEALAELIKPDSIEMFVTTGVFSEDEVRARYHVRLERYLKDIEIEVSTLVDMARTLVLPAAMEHQAPLAHSIEAVARVKGQAPWAQMGLLDACSEEIGRLRERVDGLGQMVASCAELEATERARRYAYEVAPAMEMVRESCDTLEEMVADTLWALPKYPEMLFMS